MRKVAVGLTALLFSQCTAEQGTDRTYPPCVQHGSKQFVIRNWHGVTRNETTEAFDFELQADFSGFVASCRGQRQGDDNSGWTACENNRADKGEDRFAVHFDFSPNDYININHAFACDRGEPEIDPRNKIARAVATGDGRLPLGLVDTPEGHFTGTEGDNMTIAAYTRVAHLLPRSYCAAASQSPEWEVREFQFSAQVRAGNPWVIGATVASVEFDLENRANGFVINCQAINDSSVVSPDSPGLIDPDKRWPCPISYRDDLIPPEAYPRTSFRFDRSRNELFLEQQWECEDEDGHE